MAMTEKQVMRRMNEALDTHYKQYREESEWYGMDDFHIWVFDIPSKQITVKMVLIETEKRVAIYEAPQEKQSGYDYVRETEWKVRGHYSW